MRDITLASTEYFKFTTRAFATGIPTTLAGTPVISAYEDNSVTQITAGITLGVDHDSVTGLNLITVVATGANGFEAGKHYSLTITTGTVGGVSVVGEVVGEFTIESGAAYDVVNNGTYGNAQLVRSTTPANTLDIDENNRAKSDVEEWNGGTGFVGDDYPSTQSQLSGLSNTGSASHKEFTGEVLATPATTTGGSYLDTKALDGVYMYWDSVSGGFNAELTANIGAGTPAGIKITGYITGLNDSLRVQMWDAQAGSPDWVTIGPWNGKASASNEALPFDAFISMVGVGANLGDIRLRLYNDNGVTDAALTNANIYIDQVFVEFNQGAGSVIDRVYFDSTITNTGTVPGTDGIPGNPVSTEAAVNTLLATTGLSRVEVAAGSSITFATSHANEKWSGPTWTLGLGGQTVLGGLTVEGAAVSGVGSGASEINFSDCGLGTCTLSPFHANECGLLGTITFSAAGNYVINDGHSRIAGALTPIIDTGAAVGNVNLSMPEYWNGIEIQNLNAAGADEFSISGTGQIIYAASSSGTVNQRGDWRVTNTGGVTITSDDNTQGVADILDDTGTSGVLLAATATSAQLVDDIMDENISKANHDVPNSLAKLIRQGGDLVQIDGQVSDVSPSVTNFDTNLTQVDGFFDDSVLIFSNGSANAGKGLPVSAYLNANGNFSFDAPDDWPVTPVNGDDFVIYANHVHPVSQIQSGLATEAKQDIADAKADAILVDTAAILIDTNELQGDWTDGGRLDLILDAINTATAADVVLTASERNAIADALLDRDMSTGADSGSPTTRTVRQALRANRNKVSIAGGTMTVTKEDDTTTSWTAAITTTAGDPISGIDPA